MSVLPKSQSPQGNRIEMLSMLSLCAWSLASKINQNIMSEFMQQSIFDSKPLCSGCLFDLISSNVNMLLYLSASIIIQNANEFRNAATLSLLSLG